MKIAENAVVTLEFKVYDNDTNELLEDTKEVGPFFYIHGIGAFVPKVEETLEGKERGYKTVMTLTPEEGYGEYDEDLIIEMSKEDFADFDDIYEGMEFVADMEDDETGEESEQEFVITSIDDDVVTTDGNHPFAGRNLRFEVKVAGVREATEAELADGHPRFEGF